MKRKIFTTFIVGSIILTISYFLFRNIVLHYILSEMEDKVKAKYKTQLIINDSYFSEFSCVNISGISILPDDADTLLKAQHIAVDISFLRLISGKLPYKNLYVDTISISLVKRNNIDNYSVFLKGKKTETDSNNIQSIASGYGTVLNSVLDKLFNFLSGEITVNRLTARYINSENERHFSVPFLLLKSKEFNMMIIDSSFEKPVSWKINGSIDRKARTIQCNVASHNELKKLIPVAYSQSNLKYMLDSLSVNMNSYKFENNKLTIDLSYRLKNLKINHWRIGTNDVNFDSLTFKGHLYASENQIGFDTSSYLGINKIPFDFSFYYDRDNGKTFSLKVDMPETSSQDFFESLPQGMFLSFAGIKTTGRLSYHLDFKINKSQPDSLTFESALKKNDFKILKYGVENFSVMNGTFYHTAYNDNGPVRGIVVGPENPEFTQLDRISDHLKNAVLTSEDGAFYGHRGFNEEAFRESIATNVKAGRFLRGGSTISMQLVKNVFLNRNKTVSRKIEEALIVWMIENNYIVSKDRMFEVYLNIIEWGPNVYGVKEAARFYFGKNPVDLNLAESIYLASIIPHPKYFKYSFDSLGNLKPFIEGYYKLIANHLLKKEKITQGELDSLQPTVKLNGPALLFIVPFDSIPVDSTEDAIGY